ncbi:diaminobutyrate aminotransferase apoenzyme [Bradyrhizobium sp. Rc3b]|uniref:diaminobutyrate--2-oxoglutarate transaminase n=1 Tax=Bradyrhizobium sp. Rc3b TaxID=1855322 RepID=UPI0008E18DAE|nr:diaminobutyrate--2-oxoglutarate transaminase [Bradyrhizobium sp. Rc3b]SFN99119.1 diaminobutyrate aminotransferase apoenzyme [Bradyrhizobium sp. Rc3b]
MQSRKMERFQALESNVHAYSRSFPAMFSRARGSIMLTDDGRKVIDFLSGGGVLNYGHNNHRIRDAIAEHLSSDAVAHGFDMATPEKLKFMDNFSSSILQDRSLQYRFHFTGPTGANAIEAALELARKATERRTIVTFTRGYHGMSLGSFAASDNRVHRTATGVSLCDRRFMPFDGYLGPAVDTADYLRKVLKDTSSGVDLPAAILVETVQGEGGMNVACEQWLRSLHVTAKQVGALFIIDDIQMGCGRTGDFFSFDFANLSPDIIVMSNSLSGYGLPLSMLLINHEFDAWRPGECTSTFQGNNLALVSANAAVELYWRDRTFSREVKRVGRTLRQRLEAIASKHAGKFNVRGRGMALGFDCQSAGMAAATRGKAFEKGLLIERCRTSDQVLKILPALTIDDETLDEGLELFELALVEALREFGGDADLGGEQQISEGGASSF